MTEPNVGFLNFHEELERAAELVASQNGAAVQIAGGRASGKTKFVGEVVRRELDRQASTAFRVITAPLRGSDLTVESLLHDLAADLNVDLSRIAQSVLVRPSVKIQRSSLDDSPVKIDVVVVDGSQRVEPKLDAICGALAVGPQRTLVVLDGVDRCSEAVRQFITERLIWRLVKCRPTVVVFTADDPVPLGDSFINMTIELIALGALPIEDFLSACKIAGLVADEADLRQAFNECPDRRVSTALRAITDLLGKQQA